MSASAFLKELSAQESLLHGPTSTTEKSPVCRLLLGDKSENDRGILIHLSNRRRE